MTRVKRGVTKHARHREVIARAKGYSGRRKNNYGTARTAVFRAASNAFAGRKQCKRDMRSLWIQRINAMVRSLGMKYSQWIHLCQQAGVSLDRKMMADLCVNKPQAFNDLFSEVNQIASKGSINTKTDSGKDTRPQAVV